MSQTKYLVTLRDGTVQTIELNEEQAKTLILRARQLRLKLDKPSEFNARLVALQERMRFWQNNKYLTLIDWKMEN